MISDGLHSQLAPFYTIRLGHSRAAAPQKKQETVLLAHGSAGAGVGVEGIHKEKEKRLCFVRKHLSYNYG